MYRWLNGTSNAGRGGGGGSQGRRKGTQGLQSRGFPVSQATAEWEGQKRVAVNSLWSPFWNSFPPQTVDRWSPSLPSQCLCDSWMCQREIFKRILQTTPLRRIVAVWSTLCLACGRWTIERGVADVTSQQHHFSCKIELLHTTLKLRMASHKVVYSRWAWLIRTRNKKAQTKANRQQKSISWNSVEFVSASIVCCLLGCMVGHLRTSRITLRLLRPLKREKRTDTPRARRLLQGFGIGQTGRRYEGLFFLVNKKPRELPSNQMPH